MILLWVLFLFFLACFIAALYIGYSFYKRVRQTTKTFREQMGQQQKRQQGQTYGDREGVVDQREPRKANQKIIPKNEGEYVDFEEEK
ncbi:DUF4834 domain-containing protein [Prevotella sp. oral taxon 376]|uniref:DUF4834 family protein n=1 Tax=Prevotella sp. oral taxon 376 TaxID=712466 RepID=UPI000D1E123D|nr:DUF4834 family protein [Prevotella sp. oral taxon 376]PTL33295.1 DUF4834 domain-containing protein [Prevotella sp. oral taxon 376]